MKTVEQSKSGPVLSEKAVHVGASRLWWNRFVEKVSFDPVTLLKTCVFH